MIYVYNVPTQWAIVNFLIIIVKTINYLCKQKVLTYNYISLHKSVILYLWFLYVVIKFITYSYILFYFVYKMVTN